MDGSLGVLLITSTSQIKELFQGWEAKHVPGTGCLAAFLTALNLSFCYILIHSDGIKRIMFYTIRKHRKMGVILMKSVLGPGYNDYRYTFPASDLSYMKMILLAQN